MDLPMIEQSNFEVAMTVLSSHVNDKMIFTIDTEKPIKGVHISEDMYKQIRRQSHYIDCTFSNCNFNSVGFSGTRFVDCQFGINNYSGANMTSCEFNNVMFETMEPDKIEMKRVAFNKSIFSDCRFQDVDILSCRFMDTVFNNCIFIRSKMRLCSLENARFVDCQFMEMNFITGNMSYSEFSGGTYKNCVCSFHSLPSAFGLLKNLNKSSNANYVYSANVKSNRISLLEYIDLLPMFETYYLYYEKYFPLANIYSFEGKNDMSFTAVRQGILHCVQKKDFRMLKYFCKLVFVNEIFTEKHRKELFDLLQEWISNETLSLSEYYQFQMAEPEIRRNLLNNNYEKPTIHFYIDTNIDSDEYEKHNYFLREIDSIMKECVFQSKFIEVRHNSPYRDTLTVICENLNQVSQILNMIYCSLGGFILLTHGISKAITNHQNIVLKQDEHKKNVIEQEQMQFELQQLKDNKEYECKKKELEYQIRKLELEQKEIEIKKAEAETAKLLIEAQKMQLNLDNEKIIKSASEYQKKLQTRNIVVEVSHTSENIKTTSFPEMMRFRKIKN